MEISDEIILITNKFYELNLITDILIGKINKNVRFLEGVILDLILLNRY